MPPDGKAESESEGGSNSSRGDDRAVNLAQFAGSKSDAESDGSEDVRVQTFRDSFGAARPAGAAGPAAADNGGRRADDEAKVVKDDKDASDEELSEIHSSEYEHLVDGSSEDGGVRDSASPGAISLTSTDDDEFADAKDSSTALEVRHSSIHGSSGSSNGEEVISWQEERRRNLEAEALENDASGGGGEASGASKGGRSLRRYFDEEDSSVTCRHCGGIGHFARDCVNEKLPKPCFLCGVKGHNARECMNQQCFRCRRPGHRIGGCSNVSPRDSELDPTAITPARCPQTQPQLRCLTTRHLRGGSELNSEHVIRIEGRELTLRISMRLQRPFGEHTCYRCGRSAGHAPWECPHAVRFDDEVKLPAPRAHVDPLLLEAWSGVRGNKDYWGAASKLTKLLGTAGNKSTARDEQRAGSRKRKSLDELLPGDLDGDSVSCDEVSLWDDAADRMAEESDDSGSDIASGGIGKGSKKRLKQDAKEERLRKKQKRKKEKKKALEAAGAVNGGDRTPKFGQSEYQGRRARQKLRQAQESKKGSSAKAGHKKGSGFGGDDYISLKTSKRDIPGGSYAEVRAVAPSFAKGNGGPAGGIAKQSKMRKGEKQPRFKSVMQALDKHHHVKAKRESAKVKREPKHKQKKDPAMRRGKRGRQY